MQPSLGHCHPGGLGWLLGWLAMPWGQQSWGTAGPSGSNGKSCAALVIHVVTCFLRQEKLGSIGLSPHNTEQPTHEARFCMDALPSQTSSTLIKLLMKTSQHQAKYCQEKLTQISLTLNQNANAEFIHSKFWERSY